MVEKIPLTIERRSLTYRLFSDARAASSALIRLSLPDTVLESEIREQAQPNNHHKNQISQAKQDTPPEPKISISNADPIQDNNLKTLSQIAKINSNTSLLDDVLGLLRSRFKNS